MPENSKSSVKKFDSPKEFMQARHPDLFPDTLLNPLPILEKSLLEYHLETLTSRKQEQLFEEFCRKLCQVEICPNIRPQTGSTAGGDSKVDASTYPVSEYLAERAYWGVPKPSSEEAWAFAFSCQKDWRTKVKSDIAKIAGLEKKFTKAFFVSSQFIRDKDRAKLESDLSKQYGFEINIFDRTWIVAKILENKREELAIDSLNISISKTEKPSPGPRDLVRERKFNALTKQLSDPKIYFGNDYALANDYLDAAILARNLDKPRVEVDSLFTKARDLAEKRGYRDLAIRTGYFHAWTTYWWFNDYRQFEKIYSEIERKLAGTQDAEECDMMATLLTVLYGAVRLNQLSSEVAKLEDRLNAIKSEANRLAQDKNRPNNALHAKTTIYFLDITVNADNPAEIEKAFAGLKECLKKSATYGIFPAKKFMDNLVDLGEFLGHLEGYDELFEEIQKLLKNRLSDAQEGSLLFEHGIQLLKQDRPRDAIKFLREARFKLTKEETLQQAMRAGLACSDAYSSLGLHWAARMEATTAANYALRDIESMHEYVVEAFLAIKRLGWIELRLGRIAPFLDCFQLAHLMLGNLVSMQYDLGKNAEDLRTQEYALMALFGSMNQWEINKISGLKESLDSIPLPMARWALLSALGDTKTIIEEGGEEFKQTPEDIKNLFEEFKNIKGAENFTNPYFGETKTHCEYSTKIMGVTFSVKCQNDLGPIMFSENLLGFLEASLGMCGWENFAFVYDKINFNVQTSPGGSNPPELDAGEKYGKTEFNTNWGTDIFDWMKKTSAKEIPTYLVGLLLLILVNITIDPVEDLKKILDKWKTEKTLDAVFSTITIVSISNIFGKEHYDITKWFKAPASSEAQQDGGNETHTQ